jgi:subtilisin
LIMKVKLFILTICMLLILPCLVLAKEKSYIVGFHQKPGKAEKALIHEAKGIIKKTYRLIPAMTVKMSDAGITKIKKNRKVAYVEPDVVYSVVEPLPGEEYINSWGVLHIGADIAHASGNRGAGVNVAVIDTGIDDTHPDLDDSFVNGINFVQKTIGPADPLDYFDESSNSHGTHVSGVIAGEENGTGVIGVAPESSLYAVRVLDGAGFGLLSWIIDGIQWSVENGMDIANLSIQGPHAQSLKDACNNAYAAGLLLIAAAGNTNGGFLLYPGAYDSVIAVTGTTDTDTKAYFSPIGPEVELAAPGQDIMSTVAGGIFNFLSGTSQAAPHVAGTAALFMSNMDGVPDGNGDNVVNHVDVRMALRNTATDLGATGQDNIFGFGLVNAAAAVVSEEISFTITRGSGSPADDAETASLSGRPYEIVMTNKGLAKIKVDVYENGLFQKDLSSAYRFGNKKSQEVMIPLDATGTAYDVIFTPHGQYGKFADIIVN